MAKAKEDFSQLVLEDWAEEVEGSNVRFQVLREMYLRGQDGKLKRATYHIDYDECKVQLWSGLTPGRVARIVAMACRGFAKRPCSNLVAAACFRIGLSACGVALAAAQVLRILG